MRRSLFVFLLAAAVLGTLASPALAGPTAPTSYPPTNIPIMLPAFGDGVWAFSPTLNVSDISLYQACVRGREFKPIPANSPVIGCMGWLGTVYGQVQNVPLQVATTIDITGPNGFHQYFGPADTALFWTGAHQWDEWWTEWIGVPPPDCFNPAISAGVYWNHLYRPIGPFPAAGTYHFFIGMVQMLPSLDLTGWWGVGRPYHLTLEDINWSAEFDFIVGK